MSKSQMTNSEVPAYPKQEQPISFGYGQYGASGGRVEIVITTGLPKKSVVETYILAFVLGLVGAHHFYLRRPGWGCLYFFTFGLCGMGYLADLFRIPCLVAEANRKAQDSSLQEKKTVSDAYVLWLPPFGLLGFHHFYLRSPGIGTLYIFTLGLFGIGWIVDMFRIPSMVKNKNNESPEERSKKRVGTAYAFGLSPLGILGIQHFYLERYVFGLCYFFTFGFMGIGWIVDWFRIPILVKRVNKIKTEGDEGTKHLDDAYVLWFPLGFMGFHHFYLQRYGWGILYFLTFGVFGIGWLIDGCRLPCLVNDFNKSRKEQRQLIYASSIGSSLSQDNKAGPTVTVMTNPGPQSGVILTSPPYGSCPSGAFYPPQQHYPYGIAGAPYQGPMAPPQFQAGGMAPPQYQGPMGNFPTEQPPPYAADNSDLPPKGK